MEEPTKHVVSGDLELSDMLYRLLIVEGEPDVEIHHPTEGIKIITKEEYEKTVKDLKRIKELSPANRVMEKKTNIRRMEIRFRTQMLDAEIRTIDITGDANFGKDINGEYIDIEGKIFLSTNDYPDGICLREREIGCFMRENLDKPPIRILKMEPD